MKTFFQYLLSILMLQWTGNAAIDRFLYWSPFVLEIAAAIGLVILIVRNEPIRKRLRPQDRLVFWECVLILIQNLLNITLTIVGYNENPPMVYILYVALFFNEVIYLLIVLQWLVCVDYSLNHSLDHIRRRYRHAALPIVVLMALDITHCLVCAEVVGAEGCEHVEGMILHALKLAIELSYIIAAIYLVKKHEKEQREPRFLRLDVFIIPFLFGALVRFYDASFTAFGLILTYEVMKRRDRYIDFETGLYNDLFLDSVSDHWDKKGYEDGHALLLAAPRYERELASILKRINIPDCLIMTMGSGRFLILTGALRKSASWMMQQTIAEEAHGADPSFEIEMVPMPRKKGQSMGEFSTEIRETLAGLLPPQGGGAKG